MLCIECKAKEGVVMCSTDWVVEKSLDKQGFLCEECAENDERVTLELRYTASVFVSVPRVLAAKLQKAEAEGKSYDEGGYYTKWGTVYYKEDGNECEIQGEECEGWSKHAEGQEWLEQVELVEYDKKCDACNARGCEEDCLTDETGKWIS